MAEHCRSKPGRPALTAPSPQMQRILRFWVRSIERDHRQPTLREMAAHIGSVHPHAAVEHVRRLVRMGYLEPIGGGRYRLLRDADGDRVRVSVVCRETCEWKGTRT